MSQKNTILTINAVEPALVRAVHRLSKKVGYELNGLVLVHKDYINSHGHMQDKTGFFKEIICDFDNPDELQSVLKPYESKLLAATCRFEHSIQPFRQVVPFLAYVNTPSETSLFWSTDKPSMRQRLQNYDSKLVPKYSYMEKKDLKKVEKLVRGFSFPVIVKPTSLAKSLLVSHCETLQELKACLNKTFKIIDEVYAREHRKDQPSVLVEEMIQGEMYSTDAYVSADGEITCLPLVKVITAHEVGLPGFYSYRHIIPTGLPKSENEAAFAAAGAAIKALNLASTSAHIELFRTADGWKIIEVGARIGGYREPLYREAYGIDHFYNDLAIRIGLPLDLPGKAIAHAAGFNIYAEEEGYIESIEGVEQARKLSSVVHLDVHAQANDLALFAGNGGDLIVDGILSNKDADQLEADMAKLRQLVKIKVRRSPASQFSNSDDLNQRVPQESVET